VRPSLPDEAHSMAMGSVVLRVLIRAATERHEGSIVGSRI
jgi:hypothetical protein